MRILAEIGVKCAVAVELTMLFMMAVEFDATGAE